MDIGAIDYYANFGNSFIHKAPTGVKLIFTISIILSVVITKSIIMLGSIYLLLLGHIIISGVPTIKVIILASYPAIFALIFALASWNGNWAFSLLIVLKALTASLCMVLLIVTTPYPKVFGSLKPFMPRMIFDALILTYRSIFLLLELFGNLFNALKIRGGFSSKSYLKRLKTFSSGLGFLIIRGFDLSHSYYGILNIRGYEGNLEISNPQYKCRYQDYFIIITGFLTVMLTVYCEEFQNKIFAGYFFISTIVFAAAISIRSFLKNLRRIDWVK